MISVLLPSRGRPEMMRESVWSLFTRAAPATEIEVLVRLDLDDDTRALYPPPSHFGIRRHGVGLFVGPRFGYEQFHLYANELAAEAKGDWLLLWNDDAIMETPGWDGFVAEHQTGAPFALAFAEDAAFPGLNLWPCVNRAFYSALGRLSLSPHVDTWIQDTSRAAGCEVREDRIVVRHLRDEMADATKVESQEVYATTSAEFYGPEMQRLIAADAAKLAKVRA